jgi:hypothetical protein
VSRQDALDVSLGVEELLSQPLVLAFQRCLGRVELALHHVSMPVDVCHVRQIVFNMVTVGLRSTPFEISSLKERCRYGVEDQEAEEDGVKEVSNVAALC